MSVIATGAVFASTTAHADQCALNSDPINARASALVKQGVTALEFCEPCGDKAPGKPFAVTTVDVKGGELVVNGKGQDLAYLFLQTGTDEFHNVGVMAGCGPSQVSEWIRGGKPSGPETRRRLNMPNNPPPRPKATGAGDLAGTWNVSIATKYSTCPAFKVGNEQTRWRITINGNAGELESDDGAKFAGQVDPNSRVLWKSRFRPRLQSSGGVIELDQLLRDQIWGTQIRAMSTGTARDPVCVVHQEIHARRE
jgi:hypothetical protein